MKTKIIASALALMIIMPLLLQIHSSAEQVNHSVSGYISLDTGVKIAGADKSPSVYVDDADYESVLLAAKNMKTDIEAVTGKNVTMNVSSSAVKIASVNQADKTMTISNYQKLTVKGRGIVAVYGDDNILENVYLSENTADNSNGTLNFMQLPEFEDKKVCGYLWEDNNGLTGKPLTDKFIYKDSMPSDKDWSAYDIIIGTLGHSGAIDTLSESNAIDTSGIKDKWESFTIQENNGKIIIAGSDKRGTIYGIYDFCEKIGVSPWVWWADATPEKADELYVNLPAEGYTEGEPSVKYRGIFLNDEYNFSQWSKSLSSDGNTNMSSEAYARVFELILRLKANTMWPAMHAYSNCFHSDVKNTETADKYGIVIGSSHAEPLLRNNLGELDAFQDKWEAENPDKTLYKALENESKKKVAYYWTDHDNNNNPVDNKEFLEAYWRDSVKQYGGYENIYTLGMRGVHDGSFQTNMDKATALNEIIAAQRKILKEEIADKQGISIEDIPQVFIPYKDIQSLYNEGKLNVPDDVTIMWTDDNYGYVRQNADDAERARDGRTGIYYHVSYYGYPSSYLWLSTTQPGLIREEMSKSYDMGADKVWILNTGDLKPAEKEIEYFTRLARNIGKMRSEDISDIYASNAKRDFNMNDTDSAEYAEIMDKFYETANAKRPDFFRTNDADNKLNISLSAYGDEAERYINTYNDLANRAENLYNKLPDNKKAAFFELALYPIRSSRNMAVNYVQTERAKLYTEQNRGMSAEKYAAEAKEAAAQITADIEHYNTMLDGKWNNMTNINPSKLQGCDAHITLDLNAPVSDELDYTTLAVMTDSQTEYSDNPSMTVSVYDSYDKFIDVINQGYGSFEYSITSNSDALIFDKASGICYGNDRVHISVDKSKAPAGISNAVITVSQKLGESIIDTKEIAVTIENPNETINEKTYVEAGGVVSIEAEHYTDIKSNGDYEWKNEKDFGRSGGSMKAYPDIAANANESNLVNSSAYMEYNVYFTNAGTYSWDIYRMPTLNERNNMRFAVSLDNGTPVVLKGTNNYSGSQNKNDAWSKGVLTNNEKLSTSVTVSQAGYHTFRIYNVSPGVVIDKMVLSKNAVNSYFGAPESYNTTYNTSKLTTVTSNEQQPSGKVKKKYEPKAVIGEISKSENVIDSVKLHRLDENLKNAVIIAAGYDENGNITVSDMAKTAFSGDTAEVAINIALTDSTTGYAFYVVDSLTNMSPIAPYKTYGKIKSEAENEYISLKTDFSNYYGKKSVVLIADCEITEDISPENIMYIFGETLDRDSYKFIPFNKAEGKYYIKAGIDGADGVNEIKNTTVNIHPDNNGVENVLNRWTFESLTDTNGANPFAISGGATLLDSGTIKMNTSSAGTAKMEYANPVIASQGETVTVEFDITFGKLTGKTISYSIADANGTALISSQMCAYDMSENTDLMIGSNNVLSDYQLLSKAVSRAKNEAKDNKPTHFKNVIDFALNKATVYVSADGTTPAEFTGKLSNNAGNIKGINFSTNYNNNDRACYMDNVSISKLSGPQYRMTFKAVDNTEEITNAQIIVKDGISGAVISSETDGSYMLCEGDYDICVSADGYRDKTEKLELNPALESKEVKVEMTSNADLMPANVTIKYVDEEGNSLKDDIVITDNVYIGDNYTVSDAMMSDFTKRNNEGKTNLYQFNASKSQTTATLTNNTEIILVFNMTNQYDYYEDFEEYTINDSKWKHGSGSYSLTVANDNSKYLSYVCTGGSSVGSYTTFDEIKCEGKTVKIEADLKFAPTTITGDSQFSIGNTSPAFSSNKISYGFENSDGHIIGLVHKKGSSSFLVNGQSVSTNLIGDWVHLEADADFVSKKVTVKLTNKSGYSAQVKDADFYSSSVADNIGSMYVRGAGGNGNVGVDNLSITITGDGVAAEPEIKSVLNYKSIYAFGDSIVYGHNAPNEAFINLISNKYSMTLTKYAKNGATVIDSGNDIISQVNSASSEEPDFIVFDGYTNDAYGDSASDSFNSEGTNPDVTKILGTVQGNGATTFDSSTFCGAFEEILYTMKQKWPNAKIVFVTIHKSGARDFDIQTQLHDLTLQMCSEWNVDVVDMFNDVSLDTRKTDEMAKYIIGGKGSHPNVSCCEEFYIPMIADKLIKLCGGE